MVTGDPCFEDKFCSHFTWEFARILCTQSWETSEQTWAKGTQPNRRALLFV